MTPPTYPFHNLELRAMYDWDDDPTLKGWQPGPARVDRAARWNQRSRRTRRQQQWRRKLCIVHHTLLSQNEKAYNRRHATISPSGCWSTAGLHFATPRIYWTRVAALPSTNIYRGGAETLVAPAIALAIAAESHPNHHHNPQLMKTTKIASYLGLHATSRRWKNLTNLSAIH